MIYINHCTAFTHTHTRHGILKTQSSLVEHWTFAILILKTKRLSFFLVKQLNSITNSGSSPCVFTSVRVCVESIWTLVSSAIVFNFQQKFRRKGKGNLKRERRGKAQLGAAKKSQTGRTTGVLERKIRKIPLLISYLNSSVHFAQFSVEPDNIPNMSRVWINSSPRYVAERQRPFRRMVFFL